MVRRLRSGTGLHLSLIHIFFTAVFYTRKMKGAILYGILLTWILGMLCQVTGCLLYTSRCV